MNNQGHKKFSARTEAVRFPFDRTRRSSLSDQMSDGLRQAILTGRYVSGEKLPTTLEWAKMLGVSIRVPEAAIARLVSEGLIVARRRRGCVVAERGNAPNWKGHVLVVVPDSDACYYSAVQLGRVRARLSAAGYLVSSMTVLHGKGKTERFKYDIAPLEFALRQSVDLAVLIFNYRRSSIARAIARTGVPFVEFADAAPSRLAGCVGSVCLDRQSAMQALATKCMETRIRSVTQVRLYVGAMDAPVLSTLPGVKFTDWRIRRESEYQGYNEGMVRDTMEAFQRRFATKGKCWLPDLLFFSEDHAASGAFMAMLANGIRIPDDVRVVTMANWGLGPVFPVPLTRLEMNPYAHGDALAQMALDYLAKTKPIGVRHVPLRYVEGDSFR